MPTSQSPASNLEYEGWRLKHPSLQQCRFVAANSKDGLVSSGVLAVMHGG